MILERLKSEVGYPSIDPSACFDRAEVWTAAAARVEQEVVPEIRAVLASLEDDRGAWPADYQESAAACAEALRDLLKDRVPLGPQELHGLPSHLGYYHDVSQGLVDAGTRTQYTLRMYHWFIIPMVIISAVGTIIWLARKGYKTAPGQLDDYVLNPAVTAKARSVFLWYIQQIQSLGVRHFAKYGSIGGVIGGGMDLVIQSSQLQMFGGRRTSIDAGQLQQALMSGYISGIFAALPNGPNPGLWAIYMNLLKAGTGEAAGAALFNEDPLKNFVLGMVLGGFAADAVNLSKLDVTSSVPDFLEHVQVNTTENLARRRFGTAAIPAEQLGQEHLGNEDENAQGVVDFTARAGNSSHAEAVAEQRHSNDHTAVSAEKVEVIRAGEGQEHAVLNSERADVPSAAVGEPGSHRFGSGIVEQYGVRISDKTPEFVSVEHPSKADTEDGVRISMEEPSTEKRGVRISDGVRISSGVEPSGPNTRLEYPIALSETQDHARHGMPLTPDETTTRPLDIGGVSKSFALPAEVAPQGGGMVFFSVDGPPSHRAAANQKASVGAAHRDGAEGFSQIEELEADDLAAHPEEFAERIFADFSDEKLARLTDEEREEMRAFVAASLTDLRAWDDRVPGKGSSLHELYDALYAEESVLDKADPGQVSRYLSGVIDSRREQFHAAWVMKRKELALALDTSESSVDMLARQRDERAGKSEVSTLADLAAEDVKVLAYEFWSYVRQDPNYWFGRWLAEILEVRPDSPAGYRGLVYLLRTYNDGEHPSSLSPESRDPSFLTSSEKTRWISRRQQFRLEVREAFDVLGKDLDLNPSEILDVYLKQRRDLPLADWPRTRAELLWFLEDGTASSSLGSQESQPGLMWADGVSFSDVSDGSGALGELELPVQGFGELTPASDHKILERGDLSESWWSLTDAPSWRGPSQWADSELDPDISGVVNEDQEILKRKADRILDAILSSHREEPLVAMARKEFDEPNLYVAFRELWNERPVSSVGDARQVRDFFEALLYGRRYKIVSDLATESTQPQLWQAFKDAVDRAPGPQGAIALSHITDVHAAYSLGEHDAEIARITDHLTGKKRFAGAVEGMHRLFRPESTEVLALRIRSFPERPLSDEAERVIGQLQAVGDKKTLRTLARELEEFSDYYRVNSDRLTRRILQEEIRKMPDE